MEFLLINHPLDCPMCDKGGECPLQNQAMSNGRGESRYREVKRTFPKPIAISAQVLLDRERCVLCARCTRFSEQIAGDPFIAMLDRGALQQVGIYQEEPFESYFSGNTIQICPVGALTSAAYRFRARPFDLISTPSVCEHCASGCALRTDHRRGKVMRRLAAPDPEVNEEWNCDKGRFGFTYARQPDRLTTPLVRDTRDGDLRPASWPEAFAAAADGLRRAHGATGVLTGGRVTKEDAYAYAKFARAVLASNDIDFRARPHSAEEADFLAARVSGAGLGVRYADLDAASAVLLVGFEPEDESPIVFLRLRKARRQHSLAVWSVAPFTSRGLAKLNGGLVRTAPGAEASALTALRDGGGELGEQGAACADALDTDAVILVGERLAMVPGALSAAAALADATGARLAWVPRRAGERGALEAGCLPNLLPGGRPLRDAAARVDLATAWGINTLLGGPGRDGDAMIAAAARGELRALVVGGVDVGDLADPPAALEALQEVPFLVSLEIRASEVTARADVVFPVAPVAEKAGTFVNWEGRARPFDTVLRDAGSLPDLRVLAGIAEELDADLGFRTAEEVRHEIDEIGVWDGAALPTPTAAPERPPSAANGAVLLASWRLLLDEGRMLDGEPALNATARTPVAAVSVNTAESLNLSYGDELTLSTDTGSLTLPVTLVDIDDGAVWVPEHSAGASVLRTLGTGHGGVVRLEAGAR
jgi:NADH-quinone oxidoreductase subunit G